MAIEQKSGLLYEILIRGEHQDGARLGGFSGAHYIEATALVDSETGNVVSYAPGPAVELPREKIADYLGTKFANFESSMRALQIERDAMAKELDALRARLAQAAEPPVDPLA
jgi:hypothetical protein